VADRWLPAPIKLTFCQWLSFIGVGNHRPAASHWQKVSFIGAGNHWPATSHW
jgi:hypothetical protein